MPIAMIFIAILLLSCPQESKPEWGAFRGNRGAGHAEHGVLPSALDLDAGRLWRVELPAGYSSPVVSGQHVLLTAAEGQALLTICLDRDTGSEHWRAQQSYDGLPVGENSAAAPSPVTDGELVVAAFHTNGLVAYDMHGKLLWSRQLGALAIPHGLSSSPLLHAGKLILLVDQDQDSYLLALDKRSGEELWKVKRPHAVHGYSTPSIYAPEGTPAQIIVSGSMEVSCYALDDGSSLWSRSFGAWEPRSLPLVVGERCYLSLFIDRVAPARPPMAADWSTELKLRDADGNGALERSEWQEAPNPLPLWSIFDRDLDGSLGEAEWASLKSSIGAKSALLALQLGTLPAGQSERLLWSLGDRRAMVDNPSPLHVRGTLFQIKSGGMLSAINAEDGVLQKQRRVGTPDRYHASPISDGERLLLAGASGQLLLVSASPQWELLSSINLDEEIWSTPALAAGQLFVRTQSALWCLGTARSKGD